jgi:hypothetical protein
MSRDWPWRFNKEAQWAHRRSLFSKQIFRYGYDLDGPVSGCWYTGLLVVLRFRCDAAYKNLSTLIPSGGLARGQPLSERNLAEALDMGQARVRGGHARTTIRITNFHSPFWMPSGPPRRIRVATEVRACGAVFRQAFRLSGVRASDEKHGPAEAGLRSGFRINPMPRQLVRAAPPIQIQSPPL